jgi:flagellar secretion chaperone FliS
MPTSYPAHRYQEVAIKTATPLELVVLLYDAAIAGLQKAQEHIATRDIANRTRCLNKVSSILTELQANLNFEAGEGVAISLDRLYRYMKDRVVQANMHQDAAPLKEVAGLLSNLRSAWAQVAQAEARNKMSQAAPSRSSGVPMPVSGSSPSPLAALNITA